MTTPFEKMADSKDGDQQCVIVMRHGERLDHVDSVKWRKIQGNRPYDPPLTDSGVKECHQIASERLKDKGIALVVCSPFLRCLQTAQQACNVLGLPGITISNSICEVLAPGFDIPCAPDVPTKDLSQYSITVVEQDDEQLPKYPEGFSQSFIRYEEAIKRIADRYYPKNLLLVTHAYGVEKAYDIGSKTEPYGFIYAYEFLSELVVMDQEAEPSDLHVSPPMRTEMPDYCSQVELVRESKKGAWSVKSSFRIDD